jgi:hypothetical protein
VLKVARASTPTHRHLRSRISFLLVATAILDAVASVLIFAFERHAPGTEITNLGDSVFWTSTQLLTVSSQLPNPISTPARILDVFLQAYAISVVAILAGSFGAFFHRRGMERDPVSRPAGTAGSSIPTTATSTTLCSRRRSRSPASASTSQAPAGRWTLSAWACSAAGHDH